MKVIIEKLSDDNFNGYHPNGIFQGYQKIGNLSKQPEIGERVRVINNFSWFTTLNVTKILTKDFKDRVLTFKTINSTYQIDYL